MLCICLALLAQIGQASLAAGLDRERHPFAMSRTTSAATLATAWRDVLNLVKQPLAGMIGTRSSEAGKAHP